MRKNFTQGFMLVETVIAISIITVTILAALLVAQKSIEVARQALHTTQASFLLEEGAEAARIFRDNTWSNISSLTNGSDYYPVFSAGTWTLSTTPNTVGIFTRKVNVASVNRDATTSDISVAGVVDSGTKFVTIIVSWNDGGTVSSKTLSFYLMNIF